MKALTISQPYASLIADGSKWVENRTWLTNYRGPLAIHAGKGSRYLNRHVLKSYPTGVVIAICRLHACIDVADFRVAIVRTCQQHVDYLQSLRCRLDLLYEFLDHEHTEGPVGWILTDVRKLPEPIPAVGKQGLWEWANPLESKAK